MQGNYFYESILVSSLQFAIRVTIEFLLTFGEINFVEVPTSTKFVALNKGALYSIFLLPETCEASLDHKL